MKFRVEPKDFIIFIIFSIFLLYLCAIAVENFASFGNDGTFAGLNPFPAFVGSKLFVTLFLFFMALVVIFSSVSSYIFDKDKNGKHLINFDPKDEKGYSRWLKEKEMKEASNVKCVRALDERVDYAGVPLINNGKEIWVDNGEYHNLVIGSTGSGKTETVVKPMVNLLAKKGESMVITDPKGELYAYSADYLKKQGYNIIVLNFRDTDRGNTWNPLTQPYHYYKNGNTDKAVELLDDVAANIIKAEKSDDPFWQDSASDYFSGLALGLFEDAKEDQINLNSINYMSTVGEDRFGQSNYIKEYFTLKGESSSPYIFASNTITAPDVTKGSILSTFRQKIRLFSSREFLSEMLSYSNFDMRDIGRGKTAVFLIIHDEKTTYHSLLTIFIKQCYETLIDVAKENGGKLPFRTNFILDEFANMPQLKDVDSMVSAARSRDIRFTFIIQNFSQLNDVYGKEVADTIKGNCGNLIYLISTEMAALEEISKMCGEVKSKEKEKTSSTPLVTVTDLQKLKLFEAVIKRLRMDPFKTKYTPDFQMDWGIERRKADLPTRERKEVSLFDIKNFVVEQKRKNSMNNMNQPNTMGGGMYNSPNSMFGNNSNPFASNNSNPFSNTSSNPFSTTNNSNPFGTSGSNPFAKNTQTNSNALNNQNPFSTNQTSNPFASNSVNNSFANNNQPNHFGQNNQTSNPFSNNQSNSFGQNNQASNPFATNNNNNMFGANPFNPKMTDEDIDKMLADIDKKLKELEDDAQNQNNKAPEVKPTPSPEDNSAFGFLNQTTNNSINQQPEIQTEVEKQVKQQPEVEVIKQATPPKNNKKENGPIINVDVDSVIMDENHITDDEFFDDFFTE